MKKITSKITPESQSNPANIYKPTTTEELIAMFPIHKETKRSSKCLVYTLVFINTLLAIWLIFASTVLRTRNPEIKLKSAKVMHLSYHASASKASLNGTMITRLVITNTNFGHFDYMNSTVKLLYGVTCVGVGEIEGGIVEARESKVIKVMVNIRSSKLFVGGNFSSNNIGYLGIMKLRSYAELSGTVHLLKFVKKRKIIRMACLMNLNLTSHSFYHFQC